VDTLVDTLIEFALPIERCGRAPLVGRGQLFTGGKQKPVAILLRRGLRPPRGARRRDSSLWQPDARLHPHGGSTWGAFQNESYVARL